MRARLTKAVLALCLGLPQAGLAQSGEIFIPGADDTPLVEQAPKPVNRLAGCISNPGAATCTGIDLDPGGIALESAVPGGGSGVALETLVLDLDTKTVAVTRTPPTAPPKYDAPPQQHGKVVYPSVAITIEFDYDSDRVRHDQRGKIASLVAALQDPALGGTSYAVIGHTDSVGSAGYNCDLSLRRAASVTRMLQGNFVPVPLYPVGFGEHVLKNLHNPKAAENRRVTFLRLPDTPGAVLQTAGAVCRH